MPRDWPAIWAGAPWRAEVEGWIAQELERAAYRVIGPIEQPRIRFWSTQLTVPTDRGRVWFKENNPGQAFEAHLIATLAQLSPGRVVEPIAIEAERGWLLNAHQGATLSHQGGGSAEDWVRVLAEFGALQRDLVPHAAAVGATGLPALSVADTLPYVEMRLDALAARSPDDPRGLSPERRAHLASGLPLLAEACATLAATPVPDSLQHNDLHDNNAFPGVVGEPLRFFDLADALWAHPFAVLRVPLGSMEDVLEAAADDPRIRRAVDAYLENWSDLAPLARLRSALPAASTLAAVHRAHSWRRLFDEVPIEAVEDVDWRGAEGLWLARALTPESEA